MENITTLYKAEAYSIYMNRDVKIDTKAYSETKKAFKKRQTSPIELKKLSAPLSVKRIMQHYDQEALQKHSGMNWADTRHNIQTERHHQRHSLAQRDDFCPDLASVRWQLAEATRQWFLITPPPPHTHTTV